MLKNPFTAFRAVLLRLSNIKLSASKKPLIWIFLGAWLVFTLIFYLRFPDNFNYPNFFAEDGQHFVANIMDDGVLKAIFTTFNGYFIAGLYILTFIGQVVNTVFYGGHFVNLPSSLAIVSYAFLGFCAALPVLLLKDYLRLWYRLALGLLIALLPMPSFDYGTIGTIGNLKFAFFYIAFLLVLQRIKLPRQSSKIPFIDLGLIVCVYTIGEAYVVLPFLLLCDGIRPSQLLDRSRWQSTFSRSNVSLWSFLVLATVVSLQIIMIAVAGAPELKGYLDEPYSAKSTIELFVARVLLYPGVSAFYRHLSDPIVILMLIACLLAIYVWGRQKNRSIYTFGIYSILAATLVFVVNRTGVASHYNNYTSTVFDNFFYPQNFIGLIILVMLLSDLGHRFAFFRRYHIAAILIGLLTTSMLYTNITNPPTNFMPYQIGTIRQQLAEACASEPGSNVTFSVYPFTFLTMTEPKSVACSAPDEAYESDIQTFGLNTVATSPLDINPSSPSFSQTFVANDNNLSGLALYLSTYSAHRVNDYSLLLKSSNCKSVLREVKLSLRVNDNAFRRIEFNPITESRNKTFCFTVVPTDPSAQPLALQLSKETSYLAGKLTRANKSLQHDIVFQLLYR